MRFLIAFLLAALVGCASAPQPRTFVRRATKVPRVSDKSVGKIRAIAEAVVNKRLGELGIVVGGEQAPADQLAASVSGPAGSALEILSGGDLTIEAANSTTGSGGNNYLAGGDNAAAGVGGYVGLLAGFGDADTAAGGVEINAGDGFPAGEVYVTLGEDLSGGGTHGGFYIFDHDENVLLQATAQGGVVSSSLQPADADLTALAGISGVRGDTIIYGATGWKRLAPGTSTHVLTSNGAAADPSYQAVPAVATNTDTISVEDSAATATSMQATIPAGTLGTNHDALHVFASGTTDDGEQIRLTFGAVNVLAVNITDQAGVVEWTMDAWCTRLTQTTQVWSVRWSFNQATFQGVDFSRVTSARDLANAQAVLLNYAAADDDDFVEMLRVTKYAAP